MAALIDETKLYKYRLKELWVNHFGCEGADMKKKFLQENQPLHENTLIRDFNALRSEAYIIPPDRLAKYAQFLNIEGTAALRNYLSMAA